MTTPSIIIPSTSVVLLDTTKYTGAIIVQLNSLKTIGTLTTIRDIGGSVSKTKPIILSTASGLRFHDGTSSISMVLPYDTITFQPKTATTYEVLNSFGFSPTLTNTYASSVHTSFLIANSTIAENKYIESLDLVSSIYVQNSTIFYGPVVLSNSLYVSSPMTYLTAVGAISTVTSNVVANSFSTQQLAVNTVNVINLDVVSSFVDVRGSTTINSKITLLSSFTTQSSANVLQVGTLNSLTISTGKTVANTLYEYSRTFPALCTFTTTARAIQTDLILTFNLQVTNTLSTGLIIPIRSLVKKAFFSTISTGSLYAMNLSSHYYNVSSIDTSSIGIADLKTGTAYPIWACNSSIYYDKSVISYEGEEQPTIASTVEGIGSLGYLSSPNLALEIFSTGRIFSRTISTTEAHVPTFIVPTVSSISTFANNITTSQITVRNTSISDITTYFLQTSNLTIERLFPSEFRVSSLRANIISTNTFLNISANVSTFSADTIISQTIQINQLNTPSITASTFTARRVDTINANASTVVSVDAKTLDLTADSVIASFLTTSTNIFNNNRVSSIEANSVLFNDLVSSQGRLYLDSGIFYANTQQLTSLSNLAVDIQSTSIGLGNIGYLSSSKYILDAFSTQQLFSGGIFTSSSYFSRANIGNAEIRQIQTDSFQTTIYRFASTSVSTVNSSQGRFSTLIVQRIATQNLSVDRATLTGTTFNFDSLTLTQGAFSSISTAFLRTSTLNTRSTSSRYISTGLFSASTIFANQVVGNEYNLPFITARTTNAIETDSGITRTSSIISRQTLNSDNINIRNHTFFLTNINTDSTISLQISSIRQNTTYFEANSLIASTVRTSTLTINDQTLEQVNELFPSSLLYFNDDAIMNVNLERNLLISSVEGLGQIPYISSYGSEFLIALSTTSIRASSVVTNNLTTNILNARSTLLTTLNTVSASIVQINARSILTVSTFTSRNLLNPSLIGESVRTIATSSPNLFTSSLITSSFSNHSALNTNDISTISITTRNLSSIQVNTTNLLVSRINANSMAVNQVSTGSFTVSAVDVAMSFIGSTISSGNVVANTISTSLISTLQVSVSSISSLSLQASSINAQSTNINSLTTTQFTNASLRTSNIVTSTLSINGISVLSLSGQLYIDGQPFQTESNITNSLTSTTIGLGSIGYVSSIRFLSLSTQQLFTSSISILNLSTNSIRTSSLDTTVLFTSSITVNTVNASYFNTSTINGQFIANSGIGLAFAVSSINATILSSYTITASSINSQDAVFDNLLITSLEPSTITAVQVIAPSTFALDASAVNTVSQTLTTSTNQTASLSTITLSTNTIITSHLTTSSISSVSLYTRYFYSPILFANQFLASSFQINSLQPQNIFTNTISTANALASRFTTQTVSTNSLTSQTINTIGISTQQLFTGSFFVSSTAINSASVNNTTTATQAISYGLSTNTVLYSSIQASQLFTSSIQVQSTSVTLVNISTSYVSSVNFQGNTLTATDTELLFNGINVATATDAATNLISTGLLNAELISSVSTIHVNGLTQTAWIRQNNGTTTFATSTFYNSTVTASTVQIGNLAINSNQTVTIQPLEERLVLNSLLTIQSSLQLFIGNLASPSDKLFVDGSARVPSTFASSVEYSSITTNNIFYTNLAVSSLSTSYFISRTATSQQLNISSIGGSSTVILTADATFGLFYGTNPSTFIEVGYSTFTSTATTVATNGKIYVAGGKTIPSFWGAGAIGSNTLAYSVNGLTWQGLGTNGFTQGVNRVIWDGQAFIAVGEGATTISRSTDGINWQQVADSTLFTNAEAVVKGYNGYVAVGSGPNSIATSPDGITWTGKGMAVSEAKAIATNGRVYVTGKQVSFDGITWSNTTIPLSTVNDVKYNGLYFVATGLGGVARSPDGFTWTISPSYTAEGNSLNWSGDKWLLTGASTTQLSYSTDGATWVNPIIPYTEVVSTFQYTGYSTIVTAPQGTQYVTVQIWGAGGAGGASTFQPAYLGNLQVWLDANDQDTILISSISSVVAWTDKSSNAYVLSTVQTCPAYNSSLGQVIFQSTSLSLPSNAFTSTTAYTFALIGSFGNGDQTLYGGGTTTLSVSTNRFRVQGASTFTQISTNSTVILTYYTDVSSLTWRINGSQDSVWSGSYPITNPNQLFFGAVNDNRTNWQTNEFLAFNSNLPTTTVQQIEGYLAWKWGVQSNLPSSHPYKNDFSSIHAGGGGAYIEGVIPLQVGQGSTFGIYIGQGGKFNASTASMGAYYDSQGRLYFSTSGGISYDPAYGRFYPNYFSTLGLWLDGKDPYGTGSLPANGTAINTWVDKSVANRNASSIGGHTATFQGDSLQFSTAAYQIDYANFNSTAYTIFTVQLQTSNEGTYQTVLSGGSSSNPTLFSGVLSNTIASFTGINGQYNDTLANDPETNAMSWRLTDMLVVNSNLNPFIDGLGQVQKLGLTGAFSTLFLGALSPGLPSFIGSNNDLLVYNADSNVSTFTETNIPIDTLYVYDSSDGVSTIGLTKVYINNMIVINDGTISSTNDLYKNQIPITNWIGSIGEVLCFDTALSKTQRQIIEGYLASKWGLQSNLPLNHPYRNSNIYTSSIIKGGGGGGAATGLLLPNGQAIIAGGGGGGGQGTQWDGGAGGLDVGQRGSMVDGCNSFGYSPYAYEQGIPGAGGGGSSNGGQGAYAPNGAHGGDGIRGQGGQGGADGWHLSLPGGGGGGGAFGGGGGAVLSPAGGGNSLWRTVAGFLPSFTRSKPGYGQGQNVASGGTNQSAGSDGLIKITFQTQALNSFTALTSANALTNGYQNITVGSMNLQTDSPPLYIPSTTMIQAFYSTLVINNTMFIDSVTNKVGINISQVSTATLQVNGTISKTAGSFVIDHPDPSKQSMKLRHCFVESPTHGDTIYRWCLSTVDCRYELTLPSYFTALNTNPQVWVTPDDLEQVGRATVQGGILKLETTGNGLFTVLCVATRKDLDAVKYFDKDEY